MTVALATFTPIPANWDANLALLDNAGDLALRHAEWRVARDAGSWR